MKFIFLLVITFIGSNLPGQDLCDSIKLYDEMSIAGEQPRFHKLKQFELFQIPHDVQDKMKREMISHTSREFVSTLMIRSVRLFDSTVAQAWAWMNPPLADKNGDTVYHFYSLLYETITFTQTPFIFRVDFLKNGALLNDEQLKFYHGKMLDLKSCKEIIQVVSADTVQPIVSIEYLALAYSPDDQLILWTVVEKTGQESSTKYVKEINAQTGEIMRRIKVDLNPVLKEARIK